MTTFQVFERGQKLHFFLTVGPADGDYLYRRASDGHSVRKDPTLRHAATLVPVTTEEVPLAIRIQHGQRVPGRSRGGSRFAPFSIQ